MRIPMTCAAMAAAAFACTSTVQAHVTLENQKSPANATYKAVLRVPHGCEGKPTNAVRVRIPEGVIAVQPMPKPGWQTATVKGKYEQSYQLYGNTLTEGVREIVWSGGDLPSDFYDEFVFRVRLTDFPVGSTVYFPVVQDCPDGAVERWIEIPAAGKQADDYKEPAPGLLIVEPTKAN